MRTNKDFRLGPIIAVADAHLGLLAGKRFYLLRNNSQCDALAFSDFVIWLQKLQIKEKVAIKRGKWGPPIFVRKVRQFIIVGDHLELWDASDAAVDMASKGIWHEMEKLSCKKIYVVGNHDFAYSKVTGRSPQGTVPIQVLSNTYPETGWLTEELERGRESFVFLHGHQFDFAFRYAGGLWPFVSYLRDGAEAFRLWGGVLAVIAFFLLSVSLIGWSFPWLFGPFVSSLSGIFGSVALTLFLAGSIPRVMVTIGRPVYEHLAGARYEPRKTLDGFAGWWKKFRRLGEIPEGRLYVVYGHTHEMDVFDWNEILKYTGVEVPKELVLINIPSWVSDVRPEYRNIFRDAFLYIDDDYHMLGWDWRLKRPFYIPLDIARTIAAGIPIDADTVKDLEDIGWPMELLEKIMRRNAILAKKHPLPTSRVNETIRNKDSRSQNYP